MATLNLQVGANDDDILVNKILGTVNKASDQNVAGRSATDKYVGCGLRFTNVTIPKNSTIVTAYLTFKCRTANAVTKVNTRISAEDVDNPGDFLTDDYAAFMARYGNKTTEVVDWDAIAAWTANAEYQSEGIEKVIQELVNRVDWDSGDALVIFWEDFDQRSTKTDARRRAYSHNSSSGDAPKLYIEYTTGWTGKIAGVTNPARIMDVAKAKIATVKEVA